MIGAGSSGIAACQVLNARGIEFECFEKGSGVGGNWRYENDNGMSSAYRSLHINTSRGLMAYATYPMPEDYPDYPSHWQIAKYFDDYVDHFGFRENIRFSTEVTDVRPAGRGNGAGGGYDVSWRDSDGNEGTTQYSNVLVANGHHWDARWPEPAFPGQDTFTGEQMHVHDYREHDVLVGKHVLVLGIGNSATDIAVESSRIADKTFLAMRRSAYIIPKYVRGRPSDEAGSPQLTRLPLVAAAHPLQAGAEGRRGDADRLRAARARPQAARGPPDGLVRPAPADRPRRHRDQAEHLEASTGGTVHFADGSSEQIDLVIYCTGYKITFPFFDPEFVEAPENRLDLYRRVVDPDHPGLYFIGFIQPLGAIMPLSEAQSEWVADILEGEVTLPGPHEMRRVMRRENRRMAKRYVSSKRHTIQVDFHPYLRTLKAERRAGRRRDRFDRLRARRSHELRRA